jgi:hypothetical protein
LSFAFSCTNHDDCTDNCFVIPVRHWLALSDSQWMIDTSCAKVFYLG